MKLHDILRRGSVGVLGALLGVQTLSGAPSKIIEDLVSVPAVHAEEAAKSKRPNYSYNDFKGIEEVIPDGQYNVQLFSPPSTEGSKKFFLYILTPSNGSKVAIEEPYYVNDLGIKTPQQLADLVQQTYGNDLRKFEMMTDTIQYKKTPFGYSIGRKGAIEVSDVRPNKAEGFYSIYLRGPGSSQSSGGAGGSGPGGTGSGGGSGAGR